MNVLELKAYLNKKKSFDYKLFYTDSIGFRDNVNSAMFLWDKEDPSGVPMWIDLKEDVPIEGVIRMLGIKAFNPEIIKVNIKDETSIKMLDVVSKACDIKSLDNIDSPIDVATTKNVASNKLGFLINTFGAISTAGKKYFSGELSFKEENQIEISTSSPKTFLSSLNISIEDEATFKVAGSQNRTIEDIEELKAAFVLGVIQTLNRTINQTVYINMQGSMVPYRKTINQDYDNLKLEELDPDTLFTLNYCEA